mmetsp:Transcript_70271/g.138152  ORF Transcript_70271/g.138152 Transcript_70271/m.138152 type:complete len:277 (-) Transcript_70271:309-1139(-)
MRPQDPQRHHERRRRRRQGHTAGAGFALGKGSAVVVNGQRAVVVPDHEHVGAHTVVAAAVERSRRWRGGGGEGRRGGGGSGGVANGRGAGTVPNPSRRRGHSLSRQGRWGDCGAEAVENGGRPEFRRVADPKAEARAEPARTVAVAHHHGVAVRGPRGDGQARHVPKLGHGQTRFTRLRNAGSQVPDPNRPVRRPRRKHRRRRRRRRGGRERSSFHAIHRVVVFRKLVFEGQGGFARVPAQHRHHAVVAPHGQLLVESDLRGRRHPRKGAHAARNG